MTATREKLFVWAWNIKFFVRERRSREFLSRFQQWLSFVFVKLKTFSSRTLYTLLNWRRKWYFWRYNFLLVFQPRPEKFAFLTINKSFLRDLHSACCVPPNHFAQEEQLPCLSYRDRILNRFCWSPEVNFMCDKIIFGKLIFSASPDEPETIVGLFIFLRAWVWLE